MTTINLHQPQTIPLDLSSYSLQHPSHLGIHPSFLSLVHLHKHYQNFESELTTSLPDRSVSHANSSTDNSSCKSSDSDSTASPPTRENVIVKNESRRKKELVKDEAYWERRRKNNDAAKRSRDSRRQKEDEMACRAASLEQENVRLREELDLLRAETEQLRNIIMTPPAPAIQAPLALRGLTLGNFPGSGPLLHSSGVITSQTPFSSQLRLHIPDSSSTLAGFQRNTVLVGLQQGLLATENV